MSLNRIVCAANSAVGSPLILGPRHWDETMHRTYQSLKASHDFEKEQLGLTMEFPETHVFTQGFIDKHGDFKTRQQAWHIALAAGQIIRKVGGPEGTLFSEHLY